eukprot:1109411-Rhodomonas_salina.1
MQLAFGCKSSEMPHEMQMLTCTCGRTGAVLCSRADIRLWLDQVEKHHKDFGRAKALYRQVRRLAGVLCCFAACGRALLGDERWRLDAAC